MLLLSRRDVEQLLDTGQLVDALATAMSDLSAGHASAPPRVGARVPERDAVLGAMPGYSPAVGVLAAKLVTLFPHNTDRPTHQALIAVFDARTGEPVAVMDGTAITEARTAACSALSIRLLARPDARVLAVLGTGVQARAHALAATTVHRFTEVRIAGRDPARAAALAADLKEQGLPVRAVESWREASDGADVVCATTRAQDPVVRRAWIGPGVHITSVGSSPHGREVDDATVASALVVVEHRSTAVLPFPAGTGDLSEPLSRGLLDTAGIVEIGELVDGRRPGRTSPEQITLYKSVGIAVEDVAAVGLVLSAARERGLGQHFPL
ncbi:MAG TPA: ornithine cyclodeaminase family protein [Geodermatophilus sp.]|nr:ornithine cyclodeaminase family protein [Geodermatophilus sp.]